MNCHLSLLFVKRSGNQVAHYIVRAYAFVPDF